MSARLLPIDSPQSTDSHFTNRRRSLLSGAAALLAAALISCGPGSDSPGSKSSGIAENADGPGTPAGLVRETERDERFAEMTRFISGRANGENGGRYAGLTDNQVYAGFARRVTAAWDRYNENHLQPMRAWNTNLEGRGCGPNVFYPFSGPDITHAVSLFPDAPTYVMFGLEPVGPIPSPNIKGGAGEARQLSAVFNAVGDVLGRNFFKTIDMAVDIGQNNYSGVAGLLLFFLGNLEYEVLNGFRVYIAEDGSIREHTPITKQPATGVTYFFRRPGGEVQQLSYFSINLADSAYGTNVKNFLKGRRQIVTMLKAASYLMYRPSFDGMRDTILGRSNCILTDSSGVPFHYLNSARWNLDLYGVYRRPVPLFSSRFQADLFQTLQNTPTERLPFSYGYNYGPGLSHLIFAIRDVDRNPWFSPVFDDSTSIGENTVWQAGRRTMVVERQYTSDEIALDREEAAETRFERPTLLRKN